MTGPAGGPGAGGPGTPGAGRRTAGTLRVDWTACDGRGLCAELLPELIERDDWGYPILTDPQVPAELAAFARRAVTDCPTLALRLLPTEPN